MQLEIVTPEKKLYAGKVNLVQVPGSKGSFAILKNHAPIVATLDAGKVRIVDSDHETIEFPVSGGIVEVNKNVIMILAE